MARDRKTRESELLNTIETKIASSNLSLIRKSIEKHERNCPLTETGTNLQKKNLNFRISPKQRQSKYTTINFLIPNCYRIFFFNSAVCSSCKSERSKLKL